MTGALKPVVSNTVTTAYSEAKERDDSSRISSCQVKTSPSTNGAITKTSYPPRGNSTYPTSWKITPEVISGTGRQGSFLDPQTGLLQMCLN